MSKTRGSFRLPRVYPITDTHISGLSHAEQVALFADGGATLVQLRDKHASGSQFYEQAKAALAVAAERGVRIVINDRVDVALALGGVDVHLGQDDMPPEAARRLLGDDAVIGFSTHTLNQAIEAATWPIDYLAIGPVFPTATKENPDPLVGVEGVRVVRAATRAIPLVAIGGITPANARKVIEAGADAVAMISGLLTVSGDNSSTLRNLFASLAS
jgi:thiamine-phosphate pyrophosphorylase